MPCGASTQRGAGDHHQSRRCSRLPARPGRSRKEEEVERRPDAGAGTDGGYSRLAGPQPAARPIPVRLFDGDAGSGGDVYKRQMYLLYSVYDSAQDKDSVAPLLDAHIEQFIAKVESCCRKDRETI